jgi:hypothetical protein
MRKKMVPDPVGHSAFSLSNEDRGWRMEDREDALATILYLLSSILTPYGERAKYMKGKGSGTIFQKRLF